MEGLNFYDIGMIIVFIIGYTLITLEHFTKINKATVAIMMAITCWSLQLASHRCPGDGSLCFAGHISTISQIIFFLIGALTIVEIINSYQGFRMISDYIDVSSKKKLLWVVGIVTFFLSSLLDNLTTTIVMITLMRKLLDKGEDRLLIGGGIVIAANAGGAWTPIGDVTTTMLWIGGQVSTVKIMFDLFLPSIVCMVVSFGLLSLFLEGNFKPKQEKVEQKSEPFARLIFFLGVGVLVFVPIFKLLTGLPPFMGILFGLSFLWIISDVLHYRHADRDHLKVPHALSRIDLSSMLFFLGILLCIGALDAAKILEKFAVWLDIAIGNTVVIATLIGLASAVVDNVPLVAASMSMYNLAQYPVDSSFWQLIAYCAGTGGSILIIGSAAGVVFMGMEKVDFFWYMRKICLPALLGYFAGIIVYLIM